MGQDQCSSVCKPDLNEFEIVTSYEVNTSRLDLSNINVLLFEKRIKKFAHPCNQGKVSIQQLKHSFKDTEVFVQLGNPLSVVHRLLVSPFFKDLRMTHNNRDADFYEGLKVMGRVMSTSPVRQKKS